ncbi:MAG TPA: hypothetical protein VLE99_00270 [Candidatus Saccharimonadales bacterium]|nr:hypothetical protein [Candidatus Saccharimonadales bacterium]
MDFRQITQPEGGRPVASPTVDGPERKAEKLKGVSKGKERNWLQLFNGFILIGIAVLVACVALALTRSNGNLNERQYIDSTKYQAIFLNNGQVYFGHISALNSQYVRVTNIYYLTQGNDSSSYSLIKLGCQQIHDPYDAMVINRDQVTFWENLQDDGKVASSIKQYVDQSKGKTQAELCAQVSNQTQASTSNTQGNTTNSNSTNGSTTTGK